MEKKELLIEQLREEVETRMSRIDVLQTELSLAREDVRQYTQALAALTGDRRQKTQTPAKRPNVTGLGISNAKMTAAVAAIRAIAAEQDEFRQVDVRTRTGMRSNEAALAFRALRNDGVIRLTRQDGNNKWFALTRQALRDGQNGVSDDE